MFFFATTRLKVSIKFSIESLLLVAQRCAKNKIDWKCSKNWIFWLTSKIKQVFLRKKFDFFNKNQNRKTYFCRERFEWKINNFDPHNRSITHWKFRKALSLWIMSRCSNSFYYVSTQFPFLPSASQSKPYTSTESLNCTIIYFDIWFAILFFRVFKKFAFHNVFCLIFKLFFLRN